MFKNLNKSRFMQICLCASFILEISICIYAYNVENLISNNILNFYFVGMYNITLFLFFVGIMFKRHFKCPPIGRDICEGFIYLGFWCLNNPETLFVLSYIIHITYVIILLAFIYYYLYIHKCENLNDIKETESKICVLIGLLLFEYAQILFNILC